MPDRPPELLFYKTLRTIAGQLLNRFTIPVLRFFLDFFAHALPINNELQPPQNILSFNSILALNLNL
jgi:hypothetical protein